MATANRPHVHAPSVDLKLLIPTVLLIAAEAWFLLTQTTYVIVPLMWMAPMDLFLLVAALDETLAMSEIALILFVGRFLFVPFLLVVPMSNFLLFYILFMAPVDVMIVAYTLRATGRKITGAGAAG
jgi:hypothetical protein